MRTGTAHFVSHTAAYRYYRDQGSTFDDVDGMLDRSEIFIGPPAVKEGQTLTVIDGGLRYAIEDGTP